MLPEKTQFVKPYFIDLLGEEGLTAHDIALALNVDVEGVLRKIKRGKTIPDLPLFRSMTYVIQQEIQEVTGHRYSRDMETFALNVSAAKALVARWQNHRGDSYLNYLFDCEKIATELTPKLLAENKTLKEKLIAAEECLRRNGAVIFKEAKKKAGMILAPIFKQTVFGTLEVAWELTSKKELSETQQIQAALNHVTKTLNGLSKKLVDLNEKSMKNDLEKRNHLYLVSQEKDDQ